MKTDLLLEAKAAFYSWRNLVGARKHANAELKEKAVALLYHYSSTKICQTLEISPGALKRWSKANHSSVLEKRAPSFVSLPIESPAITPPAKAMERRVVIKFPSGAALEIFAALPDEISQLAGLLLKAVI